MTPKSAGISFKVNKPHGAQIAHYKLGCHKGNIKTSAACMSPMVNMNHALAVGTPVTPPHTVQ